MVEVQSKKKAVLIEPDCDYQPPRKKRIVDSQSELVQALLQLKGGHHSLTTSCSGPLLHPSAFCSFPSRTPRRTRKSPERRAASPRDAYATISDDEDEQPILQSANQAKATYVKAPRTSIALTQCCHLPPGRPLPPAPCFPRCPPPPLVTSESLSEV